MKHIEQLILVLVCLGVMKYLIDTPFPTTFSTVYSSEGVGITIQKQYIIPVQFLIRILLQIGLATWIYFRAVGTKKYKWIWSLFSLFFGIYGVIIYFLKQLLNQNNFSLLKSQNNTNEVDRLSIILIVFWFIEHIIIGQVFQLDSIGLISLEATSTNIVGNAIFISHLLSNCQKITLHLGLAGWLYSQEVKEKNHRLLWSLFSLIFGIDAVIIYFLKQLVDGKNYKSNTIADL